MDVCERIRFWLHESGMTQKELANRSDITEAAISKYVRGEREPRSLTLSRIAAAFGVTVADFLGTTHVGASVRISCLFKAQQYSIVETHTTFYFSIHRGALELLPRFSSRKCDCASVTFIVKKNKWKNITGPPPHTRMLSLR